jgi:Zn-finger nucleic acid-binding protein/LysM repeat protein
MPRSPMRARSRFTQFVAGTGSALLLIVLVAGIPLALGRLGAGLLPHHVPSMAAVRAALLHKDVSGTLFMQVIVVVGWVAWASFALSVVVELVARFRGRGTVRLPGMRAQQRWAAALIAAITLMFATPAIANAASMVGSRPAAAVAVTTAPAAPLYSATNPAHVGPAGGAVRTGPSTTVADSSTRPVDAPQVLTYHVKHGDYLGAIAKRFDGSFDEYHALAKANNITDPAHIEAGWTIRLPISAVDQGPTAHAGGSVSTGNHTAGGQTGPATGTPTPDPSASGSVVPITPAPGSITPSTGQTPAVRSSNQPATPAATAPTPTVTPSASHPAGTHVQAAGSHVPAGITPAHSTSGGSGSSPGSSDAGGLIVEMLEASGTLAAVVALSLLAVSRREQLQRRLVKHVPAVPATGGKMPRLMAPTQQRDVIRVDRSLRSLAALVDGWPIERIPQIAGVWLDHGTVTLMLADDCGPAPKPFDDDPNGWTLTPAAMVAQHADQLAPLPTLVTVGGRAGQHLLLDIEYLRVLGVGGDPAEAMNLLRFIAAELTHNVWSDDVRIVLAGFGDGAAGLAAIDAGRIRVQESVGEAIIRFRRRVARAVANWDAPPGPPEVLLVARPSIEECSDLSALERDLMRAPGVGMAVVIGGTPDGYEASRYQIRVGTDGLLRVGFLGDAIMPAASLPATLVPEVASLIAGARRDGDTSPIDLARAASQALVKAAAASSQGGPTGRVTVARRTATLAGQHRRPPGQKPEPRETFVDLMKPRHVRSA